MSGQTSDVIVNLIHKLCSQIQSLVKKGITYPNGDAWWQEELLPGAKATTTICEGNQLLKCTKCGFEITSSALRESSVLSATPESARRSGPSTALSPRLSGGEEGQGSFDWRWKSLA